MPASPNHTSLFRNPADVHALRAQGKYVFVFAESSSIYSAYVYTPAPRESRFLRGSVCTVWSQLQLPEGGANDEKDGHIWPRKQQGILVRIASLPCSEELACPSSSVRRAQLKRASGCPSCRVSVTTT